MSEAYPFEAEAEDDIEIRELDLESVDAKTEARITIGQLVGESESWRYGHVIVDEAQDLTPMQWRMIMRRVRGHSLTIVGDLAQRSSASASSWNELLPAELADARRQDLTVNYRSPVEIHELAVAVLEQFASGVVPSKAIRSSGWAPEFEQVTDRATALTDSLERLSDQVGGQVAVITLHPDAAATMFGDGFDERVRFLTPRETKGLEFDAVVLMEPADIWDTPAGPSELYIALTRATQRLVVLYQRDLPAVLRDL